VSDASFQLRDHTQWILDEVGRECDRHAKKGYDQAHDDAHSVHDLIYWAKAYTEQYGANGYVRSDLVKATSLLVAAIRRHDRGLAQGIGL
jgi:hypothetical protein